MLLALGAALSYGLSDFVGGVASKRVSAWSVAFVAQASGAVAMLVVALLLPGEPTVSDLTWAAAAGVGNGLGTAFLYRGLAMGRMAVVAPVSGVGAAMLPVVTGVGLGERPSGLVWIGILVALPGIWLVSREPTAEPAADPGTEPMGGLVDGVLAGLGFGFLFVALAQIRDEAGLLPLALNQVVAAVAVIAIATALRADWIPREPTAALGIVSGLLGALATFSFMVASQLGFLSITAVITSLYPAFTVLLAATMLREHIHPTRAVGLALCTVAVVLVATG